MKENGINILDDLKFLLTYLVKIIDIKDNELLTLYLHSLIEFSMDRIIIYNFDKHNVIFDNYDLNSFKNKLEIIKSLGIIKNDVVFKNITTINYIRNKYAHDIVNFSFSNQQIIDKVNSLQIIDLDSDIEKMLNKDEKYSDTFKNYLKASLSTISSLMEIVVKQRAMIENGYKIFNKKFEIISSSEFYKKYKENPTFTQFYMDKEGNFALKKVGPNKENLYSFVLHYRSLIQGGEISSVYNLWKNLKNILVKEKIKEEFSNIRNELNKYLDADSKFRYQDLEITNRKLIDIFFYSELFHSDPYYIEIVEHWKQTPPLRITTWSRFEQILFYSTDKYLSKIYKLNKKIIKELEKEEIDLSVYKKES